MVAQDVWLEVEVGGDESPGVDELTKAQERVRRFLTTFPTYSQDIDTARKGESNDWQRECACTMTIAERKV